MLSDRMTIQKSKHFCVSIMNSFVAYDFDYVKNVMTDSKCMMLTKNIIAAT